MATPDPDRPDDGAPAAAAAGQAAAPAAVPGAAPHGGRRTGHRSSRRRAREFAMQGLYQWLLSRGDIGEIQSHIESTPGFARADREHFENLLGGAIRRADEIDTAIAPYLDRAVGLLSPVEHATLMVGCYELSQMQEIPYRVVINEAVELAKDFGGTDGYKYVNGVLDKLAMALRPLEAAAARR